jgi:hypothetical protein
VRERNASATEIDGCDERRSAVKAERSVAEQPDLVVHAYDTPLLTRRSMNARMPCQCSRIVCPSLTNGRNQLVVAEVDRGDPQALEVEELVE